MDVSNSNKDPEFVSIREACRITGISPQTLRKLCDQQKIQCYKTFSDQRKFHRKSLENLCYKNLDGTPISTQKQHYIYTRVSSKKQLDDLSRQVEFLRNKSTEYSSYLVISDVASGINFKRKGLQTILDSCLQRTIGNVVIAYKDRLCRFGFELVEEIIRKSGGKVIIANNEDYKSSEQELAEDLLSIVHIYSCRQMGKRKYKGKHIEGGQDKTETDCQAETDIEPMDTYNEVCV
jgi:predicted site-specific integrase-resolvase